VDLGIPSQPPAFSSSSSVSGSINLSSFLSIPKVQNKPVLMNWSVLLNKHLDQLFTIQLTNSLRHHGPGSNIAWIVLQATQPECRLQSQPESRNVFSMDPRSVFPEQFAISSGSRVRLS
jgi:hypothetical protein